MITIDLSICFKLCKTITNVFTKLCTCFRFHRIQPFQQGRHHNGESKDRQGWRTQYERLPPIDTPLPNSRWLHHTALTYVRRAQRGAYMWWKGLNSVKTGSKWAKNTCLSIPNGPGSLVEKHILDPFLTHFWSQNHAFSRHFGIFHGPKRVTTGSKWAKTTCLSIINGPRSLLEKCVFDPFLTHFWS